MTDQLVSERTDEVEDVESFTLRARGWLADNMPRQDPDAPGDFVHGHTDEEELARVARCRELQRLLYDGSLAGICVPKEYGGQGLTVAHQAALNRELVGYDYSAEIQVPTFTPCMAVILEFGDDAQKRLHIPAILKGEEIWMQFLSEPSGGSDVAGAQTTAVRDGDEWVMNGSKIWTTGAWWADWALCLARTNWDVPKHRGLSVFMMRIHQPGIEIHRIEMLNGSKEFCQEFFTDVRVPDTDRIGDVDQGWTVGTRWMYHERTVSGGSPYVTRRGDRRLGSESDSSSRYVSLARHLNHLEDPRTRVLVGEAYAGDVVGEVLTSWVSRRIRTRELSDQAAAIIRLYGGTNAVRNSTIAFDIAGNAAVAWPEGAESRVGMAYIMRQQACIGGGTTEMSRNVISERVLGMPREQTRDKDIPFRDVPRSAPTH